ncbi:unnamed protein product [Zymoseptoria tritici ST99CH_3D7]|uniref:Uncharacterized protein n=1 Tax=Zymoseptoria tritici (strain ST99CH_3D7) TaxID=1276538 RepID=A0A1X7S5B7_ZYMT9|nr:unnamed protein product [Zymoseptoria tritici ST99CH_3D7]
MVDNTERPRAQSANSNATTNQPSNQPTNQPTKSNELPSDDPATSTTKAESTTAAPSVVNSTDASPDRPDEDDLYASSPRQKKATTPLATTTTNSEAQAALKKSPPVGGLSIDKNTMPRDHSAGNESLNESSEGFTEVRRRHRQPLGTQLGPLTSKPLTSKSEKTAQVAPEVSVYGEAKLTLTKKQRAAKVQADRDAAQKEKADKEKAEKEKNAPADKSSTEPQPGPISEPDGDVKSQTSAKAEADAKPLPTAEAIVQPAPKQPEQAPKPANAPKAQAKAEDATPLVVLEPLPADLRHYYPVAYKYPNDKLGDVVETTHPVTRENIYVRSDFYDDLNPTRPRMTRGSYDESCLDGIARRNDLVRTDPQLYQTMLQSDLWRKLFHVYNRFLSTAGESAAASPPDMRFKNTKGFFVDIGKEMNQLHDAFLMSVPATFEELSHDLQDTISQVTNFLEDFNKFMGSAESRVGCLSAETNKAHKAYNRQIENLLATWTTDMRAVLAKHREYELQLTTQNAVKHFIRENYSELIQTLVDNSSKQHLAKFDARMKQAQELYSQIKQVQDKLQSATAADPVGLPEVKQSVVKLEGIMKNMVLTSGAERKLATAANTRVEQRLTALENDRTTDRQTIADLRAALSKAQRTVDGHQDTINTQQTEINELKETSAAHQIVIDKLQAASDANQVVIDAFKIVAAGM